MKYDSFRTFSVYVDLYDVQEEAIAASMSELGRRRFVKEATPISSYDDCVNKIVEYLMADDFVVDMFKSSPVSNSMSRYIFCHRTSGETGKTIACEFNLRVSDHRLQGRQIQRRKNRFQRDYKPEIEEGTGKQILDQVFPNIKYNNQLYENFDVFLDKVTKDIQKWSDLYGK